MLAARTESSDCEADRHNRYGDSTRLGTLWLTLLRSDMLLFLIGVFVQGSET